jgi:hypothetical protein
MPLDLSIVTGGIASLNPRLLRVILMFAQLQIELNR